METPRRTIKRLKYDVTQCSGCLNCVMNCAQARSGIASPSLARIRADLAPFTGDHTMHYCRQCEKPDCMEACESGAYQRAEESRAVVHLEEKCTRCGACIKACPFGIIVQNPETGEILKCDLCSGEPVCADSCVTGALKFVEEEIIPK
jgi:carbon-monoxide dehydrogenase iron sulfur subunit